MERHQEGLEVVVMLGMDKAEAVHCPRGSPVDHRGCFKCAVASIAVMGFVIVALVACFVLHFFMFMPSFNQDAPPLSDTANVIITCNLTNSDDQGRYDIFTVDKAATYLIFGWVNFSEVTHQEVTLSAIRENQKIDLQKTQVNERKIVFLEKALLADGNIISIFFMSNYTDMKFNVVQL